jgi:hypothetical protein
MCHHRLFHYTTKEGADAIRASQILNQSKGQIRDAVLGDGVYFTKKSTWHYSKAGIIMNNWTVTSYQEAVEKAQEGRVDYVVMVL